LFAFLRRPEPWPWLGLTAATTVSAAVVRAYLWNWLGIVTIAALLAVSGTFFALGSRLRLHGLRRLERADAEGAFDRDAAKAILDLRIVILIEGALFASAIGALSVPPEFLVLLAEVLILVFTAALVYLTAVYASASLSYNTDRMIAESRTTAVAGSAAIVEALRTAKESNEVSGRLIASEIATLRGDVRDAEDRRRNRERELAEAAAARAEQDRLAVRPNLDAHLEIVGGPLHNVMLTIANSGMDAFNLTVQVEGRFTPNPALSIGRIGHGETKRFNLGDVGKFPRDRAVPVVVHCSAFDVAGRPLQYTWRFQYLRSTGPFGVTTSWNIQRLG
jgi:hypothetical protein